MLDSNSPTLTTPASPAATMATAPSPMSSAVPGNPAELTAPPDTALQIAQLLAAGKIDTAGAGRLSKAGNISTLQVAQALSTLREAAEPQVDVRSDAEKEADRDFGPAAKPSDYTIVFGRQGENVTMTPQLKQADTLSRNWLSEMGFSREAGNTVANIVNKLAQRQMSAEQVEAYKDAENTKLRALYGDTWDQRFGPARDMILEVDKKFPELCNFLLTHGVGDTAVLVNMLVQQAAIYRTRKQGR